MKRLVAVSLGASLALAAPSLRAQMVVRPSDFAPRVSAARLEIAADRLRALEDESARASLAMPARVHAARAAADLRAEVARDVSSAAQYRVRPEAAAIERWLRVTGAPLADLDERSGYARCADLARSDHSVSDDARRCRAAVNPAHGVVWWLPAGSARSANDRVGAPSADDYRDAVAALARGPAEAGARVRLAALQAQADDPHAAVETLRAVPESNRDAALVRAVSALLVGDRVSARASLEALAREGTDPRAAYNLAQLYLTEPDPPAPRALEHARRTGLRALAALRVFLCRARAFADAPDEAYRIALRQAHELEARAELPPDWWGTCGRSPVLPLEETPPLARGVCDDVRGAPAMTCARAGAWLAELLAQPAPPVLASSLPPGPRPVVPDVAAWSGPRPYFAWVSPREATWELCADRACSSVQRSVVVRGALRLSSDLPTGLWYWRVRDALGASAPRVLRVAPVTGGARAYPDVDADGQPDVPLGSTGYYAHFAPNAVPSLRRLHESEGVHATTSFAGDLDGDGYGDFLQTTHYGLVAVRGSSGGLRAPVFYDDGAAQGTPRHTGDLDGDGRDDLVLFMSGSYSLRSRTGASIAGPAPYTSRATPVGDADGDGYEDHSFGTFVEPGGGGSWRVYRVTASGLAQAPLRAWPLVQGFQRLVPFGDLDGDGLADVGLWSSRVNERDPWGTFDLYPSRGSVQTTALRTPDPYTEVHPVDDLDADGYGDVLLVETSRIYLRFGARGGLSVRELSVSTRAARSAVFSQREPGVAPAVLWVFVTEPLRALRVTAAGATEVALPLP